MAHDDNLKFGTPYVQKCLCLAKFIGDLMDSILQNRSVWLISKMAQYLLTYSMVHSPS